MKIDRRATELRLGFGEVSRPLVALLETDTKLAASK